MNADSSNGWGALPGDQDEPRSVVPPVATAGEVVGIGAFCDLRPARLGDERSRSFSVAEFLTLSTGERVTLHQDRGFTVGWGALMTDPGPVNEGLDFDEMAQLVLNTVLPDDDECPDDHPWSWLAELARMRGLDVNENDLRHLNYEVVLSDGLLAWLQQTR